MQILPRLTDSFLGREKELGRLRKFFLRQHLFVIKGIGGIGKTTFALAFLEELKKQKPKKNILWIECHEGWRLENLLLEIDSWLKEAGDMSFSSWLKGDKKDIKEGILFLIDILNKKEFILFADDFHLVQDENIKLFLSLLNTYLNARIVFISREDIPSSPFEKLDIFEEKLEGLPVNVAVNLLKDLLDLHKLSHQPDNKNLLRIAEKVAGHPLLLKLTASLIIARSLDLEEIFSEKAPREIEDYLFSNVLNKFSSNERRILEVLALSDIPIAEDAIKTMLKIKDIKEITAILQRKFLLDRDASGNIFIHQLIAQYMANSMAEELKMSLHRKLGKYFEKIGLSQEAFSQFLEGKELLKASRILAGSASKMYRHGQYELLVEDSNKLEKVLPGINPRILIAKARALYILGKWEQSLSILHRMENIITDRALLAELFTSIAFVYHYRGNMEKAVAFYEKSLKLFKSSSASRSIVSCLNNMALICSLRGEISRSRKYLQRSFEISSRENNMELLAHALMVKGCMHNAAGEYEESIQAVEEALKLTSNRTSVRFTSETRRQMGIAYFGLGKLDEAKNIFEENLLESKKVGHTLATGFSLLYIGIIAWEKGEYREAMEALTAASSNFIGQGSLVNDARTHYYIALNHIDEGREEIAITILEKSLETVKEFTYYRAEAEILLKLSEVYLDKGDIDKAADFSSRALSLLEKLELPELTAYAYLCLAEISLKRGNEKEAKEHVGKSIPFINIDKHPEKFHRVYYILSVLPSEDGLEKKKNAGNARKIFESLSGTKRRDAERFLQRIKSGVAKKFSITMKDEKFIADEADVRNLRTKKDSYEFFMDVPGRELFVKGLGKVEIFGKKLISALLLFFVSNAGKGFTSEQLFTFVWGDKFIEESSAPDVRINILRLRALVEPDRNNPRFIKHSKAVKKEKGIYYFEKDIDICLIKESP